ncbi:MAG: succinate dehydrogenase [Alphaproteobacteria bacterium]|jgi:fumarate reductase subunit D|nr:succinate dehydrogenase [Alphaproteobacteria bacterium]
MIRGSQRHPGFLAAMAHRVSGLLLALFLPAHFLVLGLAIESEAAMEGAIRWTDQPLVKLGEWGLVVLLTLHLCLGLRVLVLEFLPWRDSRKRLIGLGAAASLFAGLLFLFNLG